MKGNYSLERNKFMAADLALSYLGANSLISLERKQLLVPSYPLNELDNYLLKFKRDFSNFSLFDGPNTQLKSKQLMKIFLE